MIARVVFAIVLRQSIMVFIYIGLLLTRKHAARTTEPAATRLRAKAVGSSAPLTDL